MTDDDIGLVKPVQNKYGVFDNSRINGNYTMITSVSYGRYFYIGDGSINDVRILNEDIKVSISKA